MSDNWRDLNRTWCGDAFAHPGSPAGGGGPGHFRSVQPLGVHAPSPQQAVPHPESPAALHFDWASLPLHDQLERVEAVVTALRRCPDFIPAAIRRATGEELESLIEGLLPGLLFAAGIMGVSTVGGAAAGAVLGAFAGGVGAVPGVAAGAVAGAQLGVFLLEYLGLYFLIVYLHETLVKVTGKLELAVRTAWHAVDRPAGKHAEITRAAELLADAVADLFRCVLQAIANYLQEKGAAAIRARLPELVALLRKSKLGDSFAAWVETNWQRLIENPKLRPKESPVTQPADGPRIPVTGPKLRAKQDGQLHNREWDAVKVKEGEFWAKRPGGLDMENLELGDKRAAQLLNQNGYSEGTVREVLNSGADFKLRTFVKGEMLYAFDTYGRNGKRTSSPFWMTETEYRGARAKHLHGDEWDCQGLKNDYGLPCFNRANGVVVAEVTETHLGVESTLGPAVENVTYEGPSGSTYVHHNTMSGGGQQVTPKMNAVKVVEPQP